MLLNYKGREVQVSINFEHGEGAYVQEAHYTDDSSDLTEAEIDKVERDNQTELYQHGLECACDAAMSFYEGDR